MRAMRREWIATNNPEDRMWPVPRHINSREARMYLLKIKLELARGIEPPTG